MATYCFFVLAARIVRTSGSRPLPAKKREGTDKCLSLIIGSGRRIDCAMLVFNLSRLGKVCKQPLLSLLGLSEPPVLVFSLQKKREQVENLFSKVAGEGLTALCLSSISRDSAKSASSLCSRCSDCPNLRFSSSPCKKRQGTDKCLSLIFGSGRRTRTSDLRVMSPTSCQLLHPAIYRNYIVISLVCECKGKQNFQLSKILRCEISIFVQLSHRRARNYVKKGCTSISCGSR